LIVKFSLKIMLLLEGLFMFSGGLFGPIYALFVDRVGGNILDAGLAAFAFLASTGILVFLISRWENREKHQEKLYLLGYLMTAIGYLGYVFVSSHMELIAVQVFLGIAQAIYLPVRDSIYTKAIRKGKEAVEWGKWEAESFIAPAAAAILGAMIAFTFGFRELFFAMFLISLVGVVIGLRLFMKRGKRAKRK
jgi:MFS family permease